MPTRPALGALVLAASYVLTAMPAPALALDPPQPLPGYQPTFVTERAPGIWEDCIWASASMLLDKWTNGATTVSRKQLRTLSGDAAAGSNLGDVKRAFARLGIVLKSSPGGGESVTWAELLDRLGRGGGAILLGDYSKLPRRYGRWDPAFWKNDGLLDDHALYLDRYDRRTGRILVMDPLAPAGWTGEWIPVSALRKYAWRAPGGALWTAMTPAALPATFDGVDLGDPTASADASSMIVSWPIDDAPDGWTYAGATVTTQITPVTDDDITDVVVSALVARDGSLVARDGWLAARDGSLVARDGSLVAGDGWLDPSMRWLDTSLDPSMPSRTDGSAEPSVTPATPVPAMPFATATGATLTATIPLPTPGVYSVGLTLTDHRSGYEVVTAGPFKLYVPGPRAATFNVPADMLVDPAALVQLSVIVRNSGTESWVDTAPVPWLPLDKQRPRNTRLIGTWIPEPLSTDEDRGVTATPLPIDFGPLALDPGSVVVIDSVIQVPIDPGYWRLVLDVVDDEAGSMALAGSAPGVIGIEVLGPSHPGPGE
ncbi:MAG: hypothetical protein HYX54_05715 [Chloroflexi bacterium]|nr:hypothetical protein [Chloroflexota bacterium]